MNGCRAPEGVFSLYTYEDVQTYVEEENVKFIRLAFCDVAGNQKNVAIMPEMLRRAFRDGISFDASAIGGFGGEVRSDLFLHPEPSTLTALPWRSIDGSVVRMFCDITYPDGRPFPRDCRYILRRAVEAAAEKGVSCYFGSEFEFYLFKTDEDGEPTGIPFDKASYMDIAPADRGENVRREICCTLREMGIQPEGSHHEEGPGQNEIDFRYGEALASADNAVTFKAVVRTIAMRSGLWASFDPKPMDGRSGSGMHINMSVRSRSGEDLTAPFMAGILEHIGEMTLFLNPTERSYLRFGEMKAPKYVTWSPENRSQLIRIPAATGEYRRIELRSPDAGANPYIAYALLIRAGLDGIERGLAPGEPVNLDLYSAGEDVTRKLRTLPLSRAEAVRRMAESEWLRGVLPEEYLAFYRG